VNTGRAVARVSGQVEPARPITALEIEGFYHEFFRPLLRRAVRRHSLSTDDARDVVQEAFVLALVKMQSDGNAEAWLRQVVDYLSLNLRRTAMRRAALLARWSGGEDNLPSGRCSAFEEGN
jgi:DNA-directed RNA polymerase specialized sigma24 family protein